MSTIQTIATDLIIKFFNALLLNEEGEDLHARLYPIRDNGRILITDGRICFDFPDCEVPKYRLQDGDSWKFIPETSCKPFLGDYREAFQGVDFTPTHDIPPITPPAGIANWQWIGLTPCDDCQGDGEVYCNYGHRHECGNCDGTGSLMDIVEEAREPVEVSGVKFGKQLLWLIKQLPNAKLGPVVEDAPTGFVFDGGRGVLRSMKIYTSL